MGQVIPFPLAARRGYVVKQAHFLLTMSPPAAAKALERQLDFQHGVMERRGVSPAVIADELQSLRDAIRTEMMRRSYGGAA